MKTNKTTFILKNRTTCILKNKATSTFNKGLFLKRNSPFFSIKIIKDHSLKASYLLRRVLYAFPRALPRAFPRAALLAVLALFLGMEAGLAQTPFNFGGGDGTPADPYQIGTPAHLDSIRDKRDEDGVGLNYLSAHFILTADLDFSSYTYRNYDKPNNNRGWRPIGHDTEERKTFYQGEPFTGNFNGKGFVISNLMINNQAWHMGLFGFVNGGTIDSLGVEDVDILGDLFTGGIAGILVGTLSNSYVSGTVSGARTLGDAGANIGGIVGQNGSRTTGAMSLIKNCHSAAFVEGSGIVGGLVGQNYGVIENSYAAGVVSGIQDSFGGLVGLNNMLATVRNSYATTLVLGPKDVGTIVGNNDGNIINCYWNTDVSGQTPHTGAIRGGTGMASNILGRTSVEMYDMANFRGFDFDADDPWLPPSAASGNEVFPRLRGVSKNAQVLTFELIAPKLPSSPPFDLSYAFLSPITGTGLTTTFLSSETGVVGVDGNGRVTIAGGGIAELSIMRTGDDDYVPVRVSRFLDVAVFATGAGTGASPFKISSIDDLNAIRDNRGINGRNYLADTFLLTADLDFSAYTYDEDNLGWLPIGHDLQPTVPVYEGVPFTGHFNGSGHVISNLRITRGFVNTSVVHEGGEINPGGGESNEDSPSDDPENEGSGPTAPPVPGSGDGTGGNNMGDNMGDAPPAGENLETRSLTSRGDISYTSHDPNAGVSFVPQTGDYIGLFGQIAAGAVVDSLVLVGVNISGELDVGGIVGTHLGTIKNSYVTGIVSGTNGVGGLAGANEGIIENSYALVAVGTTHELAGGLVGVNLGTIRNSYSAGRVSGTDIVGGLVGTNGLERATDDPTVTVITPGIIENSYAVAQVSGFKDLGGIAGKNIGNSTVTNSYWNTTTTGQRTSVGSDAADGLTSAEMYDMAEFTGFMFKTSNDESLSTHPWLPPVNVGNKSFPLLRGVPKNAQVVHVPALADMQTGAAAFNLSPAFLSPQMITGSMTSYSGSADGVATIEASTGAVTIVGGGDVALSVTRTGNSQYLPVTASRLMRVVSFMGSGTVADPFQIGSIDDLNLIRGSFLRDTFELMNDLDFSDADGAGTPYNYDEPVEGWLPIGNNLNVDPDGAFLGRSFTGRFNGNGNVIRNLRITRMIEPYIGLFGSVHGHIDSLGVEDVDIKGRRHVGALAAIIDRTSAINSDSISNCYSTGEVLGRDIAVGGLVGAMLDRDGSITHCYSTATVSALGSTAGGLVGASLGGTIESCYASGAASAPSEAGGFIGENGADVINCYATGRVTLVVTNNENNELTGALGGSFAGANGVAGSTPGLIKNCYATGEITGRDTFFGLAGQNYPGSAITDSYWNRETTENIAVSIGGGTITGVASLTSVQMYDEMSFRGFGFDAEDAWLSPSATAEGGVFPRLRGMPGNRNAQVLDMKPVVKGLDDDDFAMPHSFVSPGTITGSATTFSSSDDAVATVSTSGMVSIIGLGEAIITITRTGGTGTEDVYVSVSDTALLAIKNFATLTVGAATSITSTGASITIESTIVGTAHYGVLADGGTVPTSLARVQALTSAGMVAIGTVGSAGEKTVALTGLSPSTMYTVYVVMVDGDDEVNSSIVPSDPFTTEAEVDPSGVVSDDHRHLSIFPNPVEGVFSIEGVDGYVGVEVYDLNGTLVHRQEEGLRVDLARLRAGVYFVKVRMAGGSSSMRILVR